MALTALPGAGAKLRAAVLSSLITEVRPLSVVKANTTSRNTTIVSASDPELFLTLPASSVCEFEAVLLISSAANAAGDWRHAWAYPADAILSAGALGLNNALASGSSADLEAFGVALDASTPAGEWAIGASTTITVARVFGRITMVTAGDLTLQWAQFASNANNTSLNAGSWLTARRIS